MKPLVLIHGFTGSPASFDLVLQGLEEAGAVLRPTLLGHDGTSGSDAVQSFRDEVDRLATHIAAWATEPAYVVGYSLGARVALGLLVHHPGLLAGAALIGVNPGVEEADERTARIAADDRWRSILDRGDLESFIDAWSSQELFATQSALPPNVLGKQRAERLSHSAAGLSRSLRIMGLAAMPSYRSALRRIERPVDLVVGGNDQKFMAIAGRVLADLPAGQLHVVQGAGHNLLLESPNEIARIIRKGIEP